MNAPKLQYVLVNDPVKIGWRDETNRIVTMLLVISMDEGTHPIHSTQRSELFCIILVVSIPSPMLFLCVLIQVANSDFLVLSYNYSPCQYYFLLRYLAYKMGLSIQAGGSAIMLPATIVITAWLVAGIVYTSNSFLPISSRRLRQRVRLDGSIGGSFCKYVPPVNTCQ